MSVFKTTCANLLGPLQAVTGIVEKRHTLPILSNVLIEIHGMQVSCIATDLEVEIRTNMAMGATPDWAMTASARKLQDILRSLPSDSEISLDEKDGRVTLKTGRSRFNLQTLPATDFPRLRPSDNVVARVELSQRELKRVLELARFAMAVQDIRYYLNGLLISIDGTRLVVVATDGHRLSYAETALATDLEKLEIILPRKTVNEIMKLLSPESDNPVAIEVRDNLVTFRFNDVEIISKLIDGKFPDYGRVIPTQYTRRFPISASLLQQALQRAAILSNEKLRGVQMEIRPDQLTLVCVNTEQEEAREELAISYASEALDVGFNIAYLLDVLAHIDGDEIELAFGDAHSSALITIPGRDDFKYVVMPMRI